MTLLDPARSLEYLIYLGYPGNPSSAIRVTRRRRLDRKKQQSERNVFQCFVFGPRNSGKSALMNAFLCRYLLKFIFLIANSFFSVFKDFICCNVGPILMHILQQLMSDMLRTLWNYLGLVQLNYSPCLLIVC